jgi:hypothetical protein
MIFDTILRLQAFQESQVYDVLAYAQLYMMNSPYIMWHLTVDRREHALHYIQTMIGASRTSKRPVDLSYVPFGKW